MTAHRKIYATTCCICQDEMTTRVPPAARKDGIVCGKQECSDQRNVIIAEAGGVLRERRSAAAKAAHARQGQTVHAYGDWGQLVAFSRKNSDG